MLSPDDRATRGRALRARGPVLSAGLLAGDPLRLGEELGLLRAAGVDTVHLDVADGRFCPLLGGSAATVAAVPAGVVKDVHLMVADPLAHLDAFVAAGAGILTTHLEATAHPHRVLRAIAELRGPAGPVLRGVALNPGTPVAAVETLLHELDLVLLLTVDPGWREPASEAAAVARVRAARGLAEAAGRDDVLISVDGGLDARRARPLVDAGADIVVAGSALFGAADPLAATEEFIAAIARGPAAGRSASAAA